MIPKMQLWLFIAYIISIPFQNILEIDYMGGTLTKYLGILVIAMTLLEIIAHKKIRLFPWLFFIALFFVYILCIAVFSRFETESLSGVEQLAQVVALYIVVSMKSYSEKEIKLITNIVILSGLLAATMLIYNFVTGLTTNQVRVVIGTEERSSDPNHVATSLILPILLLILSKWSLSFKIPVAIILAFSMLLTGSRGGLLGLCIGLVYLLFINKQSIANKLKYIVILAATVFLMFYFLFPLLPDEIASRFQFEEMVNSKGSGRIYIWEDGFEKFSEKPLFGYGYNTFLLICRSGILTHNVYLQILIETGIIGFILFIVFMGSILYYAKNKDLLASSCGVMVSSFFLGTLGYPYFWIAMFLPYILEKPSEENTGRRSILHKNLR